MRFVSIYLLGYFLLVVGALFALWQGGVLQHLSPVWILASLVSRHRSSESCSLSPRENQHHPRLTAAPAAFMPFLRAAARFALVLPVLVTIVACKEDLGGVEVKDLSFSGNSAVTAEQLKSVLATGESAWLPWGTKAYFTREEFEADLKRIVAYYRDRGYPDVRVRSFDARLSDDQKSVRLKVDLEEGEPIRVERVVFAGLEPLPEAHRHELETRLPLKAGGALDRSLVQSSREAAIDELKDHGYPTPVVELTESPGSSERLRVITYTAHPGRPAYFGRIDVQGTASVDERIVRRQLTFRPGQLFEQSRLRESQRRLYSMELFNFVNIETITAPSAAAPPAAEAPDRIATRVTVTEGKHRKVNFGFGYGTEERVRGEVDWRHVNFFGGARTAGVFARYSALDRGVRLNFRQPYFFGPRHSFGMSAQSWYSDEPAYRLTTTGGRATISRESSRSRSSLGGRQTTALALTYVNEWEDYTISNEALTDPTFRDELIALGLDPRTGEGRGQLSALFLDAGRNTTDSILDAKKGYVASVHFETAGQWLGGDYQYREVIGGRAATFRRSAVVRSSPFGAARGRSTRLVRRKSSCPSSSATSSGARPTCVDGAGSRSRR